MTVVINFQQPILKVKKNKGFISKLNKWDHALDSWLWILIFSPINSVQGLLFSTLKINEL